MKEQAQPVAWLDEEINCAYTPEELDGGSADGLVPLYTAAPPSSQPLTDEEIEAIAAEIERSDFFDCVVPFARAIEAKLKEKNT